MTLITYQFDEATVNLILRGLDKLPHCEVRRTIDHIAAHANATLNPPPPAKPKRERKPKAAPQQDPQE